MLSGYLFTARYVKIGVNIAYKQKSWRFANNVYLIVFCCDVIVLK